jgi:hypothetical protein
MRHAPYHHRPAPIRLPAWQERGVYASTALLLVSGVLWLWLHFFMRVAGEFGERPNPFEHVCLQVHGGVAMLMLLVAGSVFPLHMRRAWQVRKNTISGLAVTGLLALLIVSAYALYYLETRSTHDWISAVHWIAGLLFVLVLGAHALLGKRRFAE